MRRIVLIDFDWTDADLLPELMRQPGVSVRLVAGTHADDPGVRVAELCGVPRTLELSDLTREIFDLALVGEHSPRRETLTSLLGALGTPVHTPDAFLASLAVVDRRAPRGARLEPVPVEPSADALDRLLDQALPDLGNGASRASPERRFLATWLTIPEFRGRIRIALERHQRDGEAYVLHRLDLPTVPGTVETLCRLLPQRLRATDSLCRPADGIVLLLLPHAEGTAGRVRERLRETWLEAVRGTAAAALPFDGDCVVLESAGDVEGFLATSHRWLAATR